MSYENRLNSVTTGMRAYLDKCGIVNPLPPIAGQYKGRNLVICADAHCVWDDLERFGCRSDEGNGSVRKDGWDFMTVNKMTEVLPGNIEHCYSNAASVLIRAYDARRDEYQAEFCKPKNTHALSRGTHWEWPFGGHGTSGLGSCLVAVALGYELIVLCGMPLDNGPHNGQPPWRKCHFETSEAAGNVNTGVNSHWKMARDVAFQNRVRSMSGRTRAWLGDAMMWA